MIEGSNPGDKVVALASAAAAAAVVSGMVTGGLAWWIAKHKVIVSLAGGLGGAFFGVAAGLILGRLIFPAVGGEVLVAKWGPGSLPLTLKGNVICGLATSFAVCALTALFTKTAVKILYVPCVAASAAISVILALLASLL